MLDICHCISISIPKCFTHMHIHSNKEEYILYPLTAIHIVESAPKQTFPIIISVSVLEKACNSSWLCYVIWQHLYGSTLIQVHSHHMYKCWFIIGEVLWHSPKGNFTANTHHIKLLHEFENDIETLPNLPKSMTLMTQGVKLWLHIRYLRTVTSCYLPIPDKTWLGLISWHGSL